jgi:hypothetical protein
MRFLALILAAAMFLFGCAGPTSYKPKDWTGGYADFCINETTYRVNFDGNAYVTINTVKDYAILRCAELALEKGFPYFKLFDEKDFSVNLSQSTPGVILGTVNPNPPGTTAMVTTVGGGQQSMVKPAVSVIMVCLKEKPDDDLFYDAKLVQESIKKTYNIK